MHPTEAQRPPAEPKSSHRTAPVQEVFSSIQGEGVHIGKRQIFVRFAHCHLKCAYCDTPMTSPTGQCHVESPPGSGQIELVENPLSPDALERIIKPLLATARHHSISFTGGEPLLYHPFLGELFPKIQRQCPTYLETSGTQPEFLAPILPWTDIIAMDIKLPSTTGEPPQFENHRAFYDLVRTRPDTELFIKLVFNQHTTPEEWDAVADIVRDRHTPLILQPETCLTDRQVHVPPSAMLAAYDELSRHFQEVRVIPQSHKMLNVL